MAIKIYFRRFVALLLCCVLVGTSFARSAYATDPVTAASLAITGGQLAGAGLSGEAALSLAGPVGAVVGITLGALGVNAYVSQAAQAAGKTRTRFVLDKLVLWGAQAGYTQEQLYSKIAQGISVAADGTIQLGKDTAKMIEQFGSWLFTQEGEVVPSVSSGSGGGMADYEGVNLYFGTSYVTPSWFQSSPYTLECAVTCGFAYVQVASSVRLYCFTPNTYVGEKVYIYRENGNLYRERELSAVSNSNFASCYTVLLNGSAVVPSGVHVFTEGEYFSYLRGATSAFPDSVGTAYDEVFTGTPDSWAENKDVLNPSAEDTPVALNPDLVNPIIASLTDGQQATMSIIDYLEALQDAWDHALDDVQTAIGTITDSLTGIQQQIAVPQDAVKNPSITNPSVTQDTTPILDPSTVNPGTAVTGLSFDLTQIFPFCIPFDIYDMLATLSATPEAPVYHVHYEGPYNIVIDFTVDLSPWDSVAAVLRTVELLAFCIGLAYVTRSMFIRS